MASLSQNNDIATNFPLLNTTFPDLNRSFWNATTTTQAPMQVYEPPISPTVTYAIFVFNGLLALIGIIGNMFVCMIIIKGRKMYTIANLFLMNLAIADMCVLAISYPLWVLQTLVPNAWPFGSALCKIIPTISDAFYGVSLGCMTTISIHRYRMILHAMYKQLTFFQSKIILVIIWMVSLGTISAPLYPVLQYHETPAGDAGCHSQWPSKTYEHGYQIFLCVFWYIFPLLIILFTFLRIKWYLERQMAYEWLRGSEHTVLVKNHIMGIKKALRMLAPVVIVFALVMLPWNVIRLVSVVTEVYTIPNYPVYIMVAGTMLVANSVSNPFIYYIMSKEFRIEFKKQLWLLKVKLRIVKDDDNTYTLESDKKGRHFVRRFQSLAEDSDAYTKNNSVPGGGRPRTATQTTENLPDFQYSTGVVMNDYEVYNDLFRNHNGCHVSGEQDDYESLKFSRNNNNTVSSGLYSIVEEEDRNDLNYIEYFSKNHTEGDPLTEVQQPLVSEEPEEDDLKETRL